MERKRDGFIPVGDLALDLPGVQVPARRKARRHFTQLNQIDQLVDARDADPDLGFMARLLALCSLPRTNPKNRHEFKRVNGPYTLYMVAGGGNKLPYGHQMPFFHRTLAVLSPLGSQADVLTWLKSKGKGYQTRMNAILRALMERDQQHPH